MITLTDKLSYSTVTDKPITEIKKKYKEINIFNNWNDEEVSKDWSCKRLREPFRIFCSFPKYHSKIKLNLIEDIQEIWTVPEYQNMNKAQRRGASIIPNRRSLVVTNSL